MIMMAYDVRACRKRITNRYEFVDDPRVSELDRPDKLQAMPTFAITPGGAVVGLSGLW